jgi:hypothetical protein
MSIRELHDEDAAAVREFNARLAKEGVIFAFPENSRNFMQRQPGVDVPFHTAYILTDGAAVRAGYMLKEELLFAPSGSFWAGNYQLPLSEGIVDRRYALAGIQLIRDALARQSRLYCLGMGSRARPLPQLLMRLGWTISSVPFLFRIENAANFTREIRWLRQRPGYRMALDLARYTGTLAGVIAMSRMRRRLLRPAPQVDISIREVPLLSDEIDELFERFRSEYGLLCDRRAAAMNQKLPAGEKKIARLLVLRSGRIAGWVAVSRSHLKNHTQFGNMTLGCIVDGFAAAVDVGLLVDAACQRLEAAGCDLLVSNQSHPAWIDALRSHGFLAGPSNFVLALSPELAARADGTLMHFTRADGDGPINL